MCATGKHLWEIYVEIPTYRINTAHCALFSFSAEQHTHYVDTGH